MWNSKNAIAHLNKNHNGKKSLGRCAEYVRNAVEAGGVKLVRHSSAKDYGSSLEKVGFSATSLSRIVFMTGDVAIIQPIPHHPHGHAAMFNGKIWVSDFEQLNGLYPGKSYRSIKPPYKIYRYAMKALDHHAESIHAYLIP